MVDNISDARAILKQASTRLLSQANVVGTGVGFKVSGGRTTDTPSLICSVTKKMGNAVARNRIRRRLRAIVSGLASEFADPTFDYVILARKPALDRPFKQLRADFEQGLLRIHRQTGSKPRRQSEQT